MNYSVIQVTIITLLLVTPLNLALSPDQLLDILNLKEPVTETTTVAPVSEKDGQAILLGQLLRKFLQDNFRQLYYELFVINATVSNMKYLPRISKDINMIKEVIPQINEIKDGLQFIKEMIPQIKGNNATTVDSDTYNLLKNISLKLEQFKENYFSDSKNLAISVIKLVQMTFSSAMKITDMNQISVQKRSCNDLQRLGKGRNGIYSIWPENGKEEPIDVYCDMRTDGGGWTIFQRRGLDNLTKSERTDFNRNWNEYELGFGNVTGDYWLGLENIRSLTRNCPHELLINLTDWEGENRFVHYEKFHVGSQLDSYRLFVEGHSGNVDDSLLYHNKKQFSTYDVDNDDKKTDGDNRSSCAKIYGGGWWFGDCLKSNLNGIYPEDDSRGRVEKLSGLRWNSWTSMKYSLKMSEMKIRPTTGCSC